MWRWKPFHIPLEVWQEVGSFHVEFDLKIGFPLHASDLWIDEVILVGS